MDGKQITKHTGEHTDYTLIQRYTCLTLTYIQTTSNITKCPTYIRIQHRHIYPCLKHYQPFKKNISEKMLYTKVEIIPAFLMSVYLLQ